MLARNLLYTAVTRARRLVVLVGSRRALAKAVRTDGAGRHTALGDRLAHHLGRPPRPGRCPRRRSPPRSGARSPAGPAHPAGPPVGHSRSAPAVETPGRVDSPSSWHTPAGGAGRPATWGSASRTHW